MILYKHNSGLVLDLRVKLSFGRKLLVDIFTHLIILKQEILLTTKYTRVCTRPKG